jgi:hypothetical protein
MNYSRHRQAQAEREALKNNSNEIKDLSGQKRVNAEEKIIAEALEKLKLALEAEQKTPSKGRKPKAK